MDLVGLVSSEYGDRRRSSVSEVSLVSAPLSSEKAKKQPVQAKTLRKTHKDE